MISNSGSYTITIRYPVPASEIVDSTARSGLTDGHECERMLVKVKRTRSSFFGRVAGTTLLTDSASAVVHVRGQLTKKRVPALLMLERFGYAVVQTSGQGRILVQQWTDPLGIEPNSPGTIHADSAGLTTSPGNCTTNSNAGGYVVYGTSTPSGMPSIIAEGDGTLCSGPGQTLRRGILSLVATVLGSTRDAYDYPSGVCPDPGAGVVTSRKPVDDRYNGAANGQALDALRTRSNDVLTLASNLDISTLASLGYTEWPAAFPGASCTSNAAALATYAGNLFINCDMLSPKNVSFTGTKFVTRGGISVGSNSSILFPNATELFVNRSEPSPALPQTPPSPSRAPFR